MKRALLLIQMTCLLTFSSMAQSNAKSIKAFEQGLDNKGMLIGSLILIALSYILYLITKRKPRHARRSRRRWSM